MPIGDSNGDFYETPFDAIAGTFGTVREAFSTGVMDAQGQNMHPSFISEKSDLQIAGETKPIQAGTPSPMQQSMADFQSQLTKGQATEPPKDWAEWLTKNLPGYEPLHSVDPETGKFKGWGYLVADLLPALNLMGSPVKPIPRPPTGPRSQFTGLDPNIKVNTPANDNLTAMMQIEKMSDTEFKAHLAAREQRFQEQGGPPPKTAYDKSVDVQFRRDALKSIEGGKGPEPMTPQRHETLSIAEQDARSIRKEQYNAQKEQRFSEARKRYTEDGLTVEEIEAETGIPRSSLTRNFKANDVQMRPSNSIRKGEWDFTQAKEMFAKGQSFQQIADHFKLSRNTVAGRLSRAGIRKEVE